MSIFSSEDTFLLTEVAMECAACEYNMRNVLTPLMIEYHMEKLLKGKLMLFLFMSVSRKQTTIRCVVIKLHNLRRAPNFEPNFVHVLITI